MLAPTELRLNQTDSAIVRFAQGEGYVQGARAGVLLLGEEALDPGSLDASDLEDRRRRAEEAEQAADEDSEERRRAQRDRRRWEAFRKIAGGSGA
jgi:F-type H+-transporting ATPase subunit epsilon